MNCFDRLGSGLTTLTAGHEALPPSLFARLPLSLPPALPGLRYRF